MPSPGDNARDQTIQKSNSGILEPSLGYVIIESDDKVISGSEG